MKLSEKLSEIKQDESALNRLYSYRESVVKQDIREAMFRDEEPEVRQAQIQKLTLEKKAKVDATSLEIDVLREKLVVAKNIVNKRNLELGLDKMLIEMKYLRLELSRLMNLVKSDRYSIGRSFGIDITAYDELGIANRIKHLEHEKNKLDAQIQFINWSNDIIKRPDEK